MLPDLITAHSAELNMISGKRTGSLQDSQKSRSVLAFNKQLRDSDPQLFFLFRGAQIILKMQVKFLFFGKFVMLRKEIKRILCKTQNVVFDLTFLLCLTTRCSSMVAIGITDHFLGAP